MLRYGTVVHWRTESAASGISHSGHTIQCMPNGSIMGLGLPHTYTPTLRPPESKHPKQLPQRAPPSSTPSLSPSPPSTSPSGAPPPSWPTAGTTGNVT
ncbi:unnamed protein product [Closterium sp. Naga37s-1]|nr:unnamed protein product [Closterium sp. Naga37s-1]